MNKELYHIPVLLHEVIRYLNPAPGKRYIDATLGGGGHCEALLQAGAVVLGIDRDPEALAHAREHLKEYLEARPGPNNLRTDNLKNAPGRVLTLIKGDFGQLTELALPTGFKSVDGILFDFGVSSHQLEDPSRGFSFKAKALLDMRMDHEGQKVTAADLINKLPENDIAEIIKNYGQEHRAFQLAHAIVRARGLSPITTTEQLAAIVVRNRPRSKGDKIHPATRTFQALRIAVNWELESIAKALEAVPGLVQSKGVFVAISFHSLEDRLVKNFLKNNKEIMEIITKKPITPTDLEIKTNPKSRSAKLRVAIKK